jgi:hypothetical protein
MAKFRLDPNIDFWKNLKDGSDHFEVTKNEPSVLVCGKHYVFDATTKDEITGSEACPALKRDESVEALVAEKEHKDEIKVAEFAASGVKPIHLVYADGGQNPAFTGYKDVSDPDALVSGPQEIVLGDRAKPVSAAVKVAVADADKKRTASVSSADASTAQPAPTTVAAIPAPATQSGGMLGGVTGGAKNVQKWLHLGGQEPAPTALAAATADADQQVAPSPLPPHREDLHLASLHTAPTPPTRRSSAETQADAPDSAPQATVQQQ